VALALCSLPALAATSFGFGADTVTVDGATPDGEVLFFSVERVPQGFLLSERGIRSWAFPAAVPSPTPATTPAAMPAANRMGGSI
jgi:hypothetical protein